MNKLQTNQKGFTLVEGLLVVLVLAVVSFVGYYVWNSQQKTETPPIKTAKTSETTESTKYLTVTEWGVKLPLGSNVSGATYKISPYNDGKSIDITVPGSMCEPIGTVTRDGKTNPMHEDRLSTQVGEYYYSLIQGNGQFCFEGEASKDVKAGASTVTVGAKTDIVRGEINDAFNNMSLAD